MRKYLTIVAAAGMVWACVSGAVFAQTHAPWPTDWNNWSDPALWVTVGNPGNDGELSGEGAGGYGPDRICGAVGYEYNIGKYEVTAGQYTEFLNKVAGVDTYALYNTNMWSHVYGCKIERYAGSGTVGDPYQYRVDANWANRPVNFVSWGDSARFSNWLTNGQPEGTLTGNPAQDAWLTEDGSYSLNGAMTDTELLAVTVPDATQRAQWGQGSTPYFLLPSEDEWYKAAYHKNDGVTGNYFDYPTSSDSLPSNDLVDPDPANNATFYDNGHTIGSPYYRTEVGAHENSDSPYGTFDMGGNVWEWNEAILSGLSRGFRGGSFRATDDDDLHAAGRPGTNPALKPMYGGFRVAEVPEPATMILLALGGLGMLRRRGGNG